MKLNGRINGGEKVVGKSKTYHKIVVADVESPFRVTTPVNVEISEAQWTQHCVPMPPLDAVVEIGLTGEMSVMFGRATFQGQIVKLTPPVAAK